MGPVIRKKGKLSQFSEDTKRAVVYDYDINGLSAEEVVLKYGLLSNSAIFHWRSRYLNEILESQQEVAMSSNNDPKPNDQKPDSKGNEELEHEIRRLREELEHAKLKALALDTMIDIAEKELKINIRKKSGARQFGS